MATTDWVPEFGLPVRLGSERLLTPYLAIRMNTGDGVFVNVQS